MIRNLKAPSPFFSHPPSQDPPRPCQESSSTQPSPSFAAKRGHHTLLGPSAPTLIIRCSHILISRWDVTCLAATTSRKEERTSRYLTIARANWPERLSRSKLWCFEAPRPDGRQLRRNTRRRNGNLDRSINHPSHLPSSLSLPLTALDLFNALPRRC